MRHDISAGGIVYKETRNPASPRLRRASKRQETKVMWLLCQHSQHKGWVFPKGLIGDKKSEESMEEAALRETEEETGIKAKIIKKLPTPAEYFYKWDKDLIKKTVHYFLMKYISGDTKNHDHEMQDVEWLPTNAVEKRLTYKADKKAFKEAIQIFSNLSSRS